MLIFYGCPQTFVKMLDKSVTKSDYRTHYITSRLSLKSLLDSASAKRIKENNLSMKDSLDTISANYSFQIRSIEHSNYPDSVVLKAIITDGKGRYITGLAPPHIISGDNFRNYWTKLYDSCSGKKNLIDSFQVREIRENAAPPYSISFVLDHSPSMGNEKCLVLQKAVKKLLYAIKKGDYISAIKFTATQTLEVPLTNDPNEYRNKFLIKGIRDYGNGTRIYDALGLAVKDLNKSPDTHKKIIILFTDGMDGNSNISLDSAERLVRLNNTLISEQINKKQ